MRGKEGKDKTPLDVAAQSLQELWRPIHHRKLRRKEDPPERSTTRQAKRHPKTRKQEQKHLKISYGTCKLDCAVARGNIP